MVFNTHFSDKKITVDHSGIKGISLHITTDLLEV